MSVERRIVSQQEQNGNRQFSDISPRSAIQYYQKAIQNNLHLNYDIQGLGNIQEINGDYGQDISQWYMTSKQDPAFNSSPQDGLCLCYVILQSYHKARKWYSKILQQNPNNYRLLQGYANVLYNDNKLDQAQKIYLKVLELKPNFKRAILGLAWIQGFHRKSNAKAISYCQQILLNDHTNKYAKLILALKSVDKNVRKQELMKLHYQYPTYIRVNYQLSRCYIDGEDYETAKIYLQKCKEQFPEYPYIYLNYGLICKKQKKYDEAIDLILQTIALQPNIMQAHELLVEMLNNQTSALIFQKIDEQVNKSNFCFNIANAYFIKNDKLKMKYWLKEAIVFDNENSDAHRGLGYYYYLNNQYQQARKHYNLCLEYNKTDSEAFYLLGTLCFDRLGKYDSQAMLNYLKCIQLDQLYHKAYLGIANIYIKENNWKRAKKYIQKTIKYDQKNAKAHKILVNYYENHHFYKKADLICIQIQQNQKKYLYTENQKEILRQALKNYKKRRIGVLNSKMKNKLYNHMKKYENKFKKIFKRKDTKNKKIERRKKQKTTQNKEVQSLETSKQIQNE